MVSKEDFEISLKKAVDYLQNQIKVFAVVLFGSYARGDYSIRHSDIDLYVLIDGQKDFNLEKTLWKEVNDISKKVQIHLSFEYQDIDVETSLLRYNMFKEGKVLFERKKLIFLKKDFDLEEVYLIRLNLCELKPNEKFNFKRSMTNTYKENVYFYDGRVVILKKNFLSVFEKITEKKKIEFKIEYEFMYREPKPYDEK